MADEYHVYRGDISMLGYENFGACEDKLDPLRTDTTFVDTELPSVGEGFFYVITAEDTSPGGEGTLGLATCVERSSLDTCVAP